MAPFTGTRYDPYKPFTFKVMWDGCDVAGVSALAQLSVGQRDARLLLLRAWRAAA